MTTIFHYMIVINRYNYPGRGWTIDYSEEPIDSIDCIHFVREPGKMNNRHPDLTLLAII